MPRQMARVVYLMQCHGGRQIFFYEGNLWIEDDFIIVDDF
jgi:hypothetical protein